MVPRELAKHPLDEQTILFFFDKDMKTFLIYQIFFQLFIFCGYGEDQPVETTKAALLYLQITE
jgi:hypothetical protein